ncbi:MAG: three-Cys-motif partner protein TcmP [Ferruginibacter sp.]
MSKKDVKENLLEHSEIKVRLLGEYLKRYLGVIANLGYNEKIRIYDLFCGNGRYDDGGEGSPLIIAKAIHELFKSGVIRGQFPKIDCFFNDINKERVVNVEKEIVALALDKQAFGETTYSSNDYQEEIKKLIALLPRIKNEKAFIFIDPYEYKHIKTNDIKSLMANKNAEVLLWLPTQQMYRFHQNGTPESLKDFIDELVPYTQWKESASPWEFVEQLKQAFRDYMGNDYFVDNFTIQKDPRTVFCMYFFSSHIRGFEKMLEAKWGIDGEQGKGWEYDAQPGLFAIFKTNPLAEKLKVFLKEKHTNAEVYNFTLHSGFLPKHTNEVLTAWQVKGDLEVLLADGKPARKKAFYISYENYKDEPQKVTIKTK